MFVGKNAFQTYHSFNMCCDVENSLDFFFEEGNVFTINAKRYRNITCGFRRTVPLAIPIAKDFS